MIFKIAIQTLIVCLAVLLLIAIGAYHMTRMVFWIPLKSVKAMSA